MFLIFEYSWSAKHAIHEMFAVLFNIRNVLPVNYNASCVVAIVRPFTFKTAYVGEGWSFRYYTASI